MQHGRRSSRPRYLDVRGMVQMAHMVGSIMVNDGQMESALVCFAVARSCLSKIAAAKRHRHRPLPHRERHVDGPPGLAS